MRTATVSEVTATLEALVREEPGGAVAFDGDGTLWSGDIGEDFFEALLEEGRVAPLATEALAKEALAANLSVDGTRDGAAIAGRIHEAYRAGTFPEERMCEIMTWAFAGWSVADTEAFADQVLDRVGLAERLHPETIAVLEWAKKRAITTYLVSASPRAVVHRAALRIGIPLTHVVSATEERDASDIILPSVVRPIPYGPGKVLNLRRKLADRTLYAAFGDNAFDVAMLREARIPVAVRPKPRLVERALEVPNLVVLDAGSV